MSNTIKTMVATVLLIGASLGRAQTNYCVAPANTGDYPPYTNWAMAATNIQDVINRSLAGDTIYLTNGHYYLTGEVVVATVVTIKSYNCGTVDPANTIVDGNNYAGKPVTNRCLNITNTATIDGLTLTNGLISSGSVGGGFYQSGAGVVLLTNCIITGNRVTNTTYSSAGGIYAQAAIIANCQIVRNRAQGWGGGVVLTGTNNTIKDSVVGWNFSSGTGGGLVLSAMSTGKGISLAYNCTFVSNDCNGGSVIFFYNIVNAVVSNCVIRGNTNGSAINPHGDTGKSNIVVNCQIIGNYGYPGIGTVITPVGDIVRWQVFRNCLIASNVSQAVGVMYVPANATGTVENCTIVNNEGWNVGGIYAQNTATGGLYVCNTIIVSNRSITSEKDLHFAQAEATNRFFNSCCPSTNLPPTQGNIPSNPLLAGFSAGNYRLSANSPCINAGLHRYWMTNAIDLDGNRRIDQLNGRVDMGAYEFIHTITLISGH